MIAIEHKGNNCEASLKSLQEPYNLHGSKTPSDGLADCRDAIHAHLGMDSVEPEIKSGFIDSSEESHGKPIDRHEFVAWTNFHPNRVRAYPLNTFEAQLYPYAVDNRFRYVPVSVIPQHHPHPYQSRFQDIQYFVVIDFEATCDKEKSPYPQEIIEFPSVVVNSMNGQLEACYQTYVRPTCNQLLSDFCKDLTGIQQSQVDKGVTLSEALLRHDKWLEKKGIKNTNFAVVTWSNWDCRVMLESECRYKNIRKPPYFNRWINLKVPFREVFGDMRCNLKEAVQKAGLVWQGRAHCGLDDAKNTARLLSLLMHKGFKFSITDSLAYQYTEDSFTRELSPEHRSFPLYQAPKIRNILVPVMQFHPCCFCGVKSSKGVVRKPGPKQGNFFFGCGNWTAARGARCHYFVWSSA